MAIVRELPEVLCLNDTVPVDHHIAKLSSVPLCSTITQPGMTGFADG